MKIGIDARFFGPFGKGLGRYTEKVVKGLEKIDSENEYVIFLRSENFDDYTPAQKNFTKKKADFSWYSLEEQTKLPRLLDQHNFDLVHFPHFNVPLLYRKPFVVTIHDLIIMHFPTKRATTLGPVKYALKQFGYRRVINHAVKDSSHVITVSEFSKKDITKHFAITENSVSVTYQSTFENEGNVAPFENLSKKFNIPQPFFLYVGNVYPHKNIERGLKAFKAFQKNNPEVHFVLVGKEDYFFKRTKEFVKDMGIPNVIFTGFVDDEELNGLYASAEIYFFPSLYEGFGLPPLEAMSHGLPVVSSNKTCMPEILGEAAEYFDPEDVDNIAENLERVYADRDLQKNMSENSLKQVQKYSWEQCAKETLEVYKKAAQ